MLSIASPILLDMQLIKDFTVKSVSTSFLNGLVRSRMKSSLEMNSEDSQFKNCLFLSFSDTNSNSFV